MLENDTASLLVENLGWTLLHSIWQIALVAAWLFVTLKLARKATANFRYLLSCSAICLTLILPLATFIWLMNSPQKTEAQVKYSKLEQDSLPLEEIRRNENFAAIETNDFLPVGESTSNFSLENWRNKFENYFAPRLHIFVWLWLAGVLFCAFKTGIGLRQLRHLKTRRNSAASDEWQKRFADLCRRIGVSAQIRLRESALVSAPVVVGWLKPVVLVPGAAFLRMSAAQLEAVIVHELIHIRRHDFLINLLQTAIETLLFFHPCVWWISAQIRREREFVCDDLVVKFYGERLTYARALVNLESSRKLLKQQNPQLTMAADGGKLRQRIRRIIEPKNNLRPSRFSALASGLTLFLVAAVLISFSMMSFKSSANADNHLRRKKMAIGFVSIPPVDRMGNSPNEADTTARLLIGKLKAHHVPAIGFLLGGAISDGENLYPANARIVRAWRDAEFEIGIGNFKHIWFYDTPFDEYVAGVEKNERIARQILAEKNLPLTFFSYPYLNTGKTAEDRTRFENWLTGRDLKPVKYTFDNSEWMYSYAYDTARKADDAELMKQIRTEYLDYMIKMTAHYEAYSQDLFGRDINQTLVLTPSRLVADTADEFLGMLNRRGYEFVAMDEAQRDPAYQTKEAHITNKSGISWFERWQTAQGKPLRDEPRVSRMVNEIWKESETKKRLTQ